MTYGSAIIKKSSGRILDVDLEESLDNAREVVERQNRKMRDWDLSTEWAIVKIEVVESARCPYTFAHIRHWCGNNTCRES